MSSSLALKIILGLCLVIITGCAGSTQAIIGSLKLALPNNDVTLNPALLRNDYRYLRVTVKGGGAALLVLGYQDKTSGSNHQLTEVWYSADLEVLRLTAGRLAGLTGTQVQWKNIEYVKTPIWDRLDPNITFMQNGTVVSDVSKTFSKSLYTQKIEIPKQTRLLGKDPQKLIWYGDFDVHANFPTAVYALSSTRDGLKPVYGEQCLSKEFCITWQYWDEETAKSL